MFEFMKKKKKSIGKPNVNNDSEDIVAPDAEAALDDVDRALEEADRVTERAKMEEEANRLFDLLSNSCGCGGK